MKEISDNSKQVLYHAIYKKKTQSTNFIFDTSESNLSIFELQYQIYNLYSRLDTAFLQKVMLKHRNMLFVFKRKM